MCCTSGQGQPVEASPAAAAFDAGDDWSADAADVAPCPEAPAAVAGNNTAAEEAVLLAPDSKSPDLAEADHPIPEEPEVTPSEPEPESVATGLVLADRAPSPAGAGVPFGSEAVKASPQIEEEPAARPSDTSKRVSGRGVVDESGRRSGKAAVGRPYPKRPMMCKLGKTVWAKLEELFHRMDKDGNNAVTREKAAEFFQGAFSGLSANAMFNEVDDDGSGAITGEEFVAFWLQVRSAGYSDKDLLEEVEQLLEGGTWVDWLDGRNTTATQIRFPKRPLFSKLSSKAWKKCEELFRKMDVEGKMAITPENGTQFFNGAFGAISAQAMFNEVDVNSHGRITAAEWMTFWLQVKGSGYKEKAILEEIANMLEGGSWVDWKDGRSTA